MQENKKENTQENTQIYADCGLASNARGVGQRYEPNQTDSATKNTREAKIN